MSFKPIDMKEIEEAKQNYAYEVQEKWGNTNAYKQSKEKIDSYSKEDWKKVKSKSEEIMRQFSSLVNENPEDSLVQQLVEKWKMFISKSYYDCTDEILSGLGEMYMADERFTKNIDKFGKGTAKLMSDAIKIYCKNKENLHN